MTSFAIPFQKGDYGIMIRLIVFDVDGTVLPRGANAISPELFWEIRRLAGMGIKFCVSSGRQYSILSRLFEPVRRDVYFLCENGAVVYAPGRPGHVIDKTIMDRAKAVQLAKEIMDFPQCEVVLSGLNTAYVCAKRRAFISFVKDTLQNNTVVIDSPDAVPEDIIKVAAYCRRDAFDTMFRLSPKWECFKPMMAGKEWIEFSQADKGTALQRLCFRLRIELGDVMAFGDNYNDLPMLSVVGYPIIMENSQRELMYFFKKRCSRVENVLEELYLRRPTY